MIPRRDLRGSCRSRRRRRSCARRSARPGSGRRGRSPGRAGRRSCPSPRRPTARRRSRWQARVLSLPEGGSGRPAPGSLAASRRALLLAALVTVLALAGCRSRQVTAVRGERGRRARARISGGSDHAARLSATGRATVQIRRSRAAPRRRARSQRLRVQLVNFISERDPFGRTSDAGRRLGEPGRPSRRWTASTRLRATCWPGSQSLQDDARRGATNGAAAPDDAVRVRPAAAWDLGSSIQRAGGEPWAIRSIELDEKYDAQELSTRLVHRQSELQRLRARQARARRLRRARSRELRVPLEEGRACSSRSGPLRCFARMTSARPCWSDSVVVVLVAVDEEDEVGVLLDAVVHDHVVRNEVVEPLDGQVVRLFLSVGLQLNDLVPADLAGGRDGLAVGDQLRDARRAASTATVGRSCRSGEDMPRGRAIRMPGAMSSSRRQPSKARNLWFPVARIVRPRRVVSL